MFLVILQLNTPTFSLWFALFVSCYSIPVSMRIFFYFVFYSFAFYFKIRVYCLWCCGCGILAGFSGNSCLIHVAASQAGLEDSRWPQSINRTLVLTVFNGASVLYGPSLSTRCLTLKNLSLQLASTHYLSLKSLLSINIISCVVQTRILISYCPNNTYWILFNYKFTTLQIVHTTLTKK